MLAQLSSIWTAQQVVLTAGIVIGCAGLVILKARATPPQPEPATETGQARGPSAGSVPGLRQPVVAGRVVLLVAFIGVAAFLLQRSRDPIGVRNDSWSDANIVVSGRCYAREGLLAHWGLPHHQLVTDQNPPDPFYLYTGYPCGASLINGIWQAAGVRAEWVYRLLPAICSLGAALLWFSLYRRIAGEAVAVVATITLLLSYGFLAYADNLHFHAYAAFTSVTAAYAFVRALATDERHRWQWLLLTAVSVFVTACFTWEYHLWLMLFFALYALLFTCPIRRPALILLVVPLLAALALQVVQRHLAVEGAPSGGVHAGRGLLENAYLRALGFAAGTDTPPGVTLATYPAFLLLRYFKFYGLPAIGALAMLLLLLMRGRRIPWKVRDWSGGERLAVILLVAGAGWWVVMLQHTAVHPHTMRHGLPGYALLMALTWVCCWQTVRSTAFHPVARIAAACLGLLLVYPQLEGLVCDWRIHERDACQDARERGDTGRLEARQFSPLNHLVPPGGVILTNHNRLPLMRVWSDRPVYSGATNPYPETNTRGRALVELRFNHLRSLYHDQLPPLYYVYVVRTGTVEDAFTFDLLLRILLLGDRAESPDARGRVRPIFDEVRRDGSSWRASCPVVAVIDNMLVFDMSPAVPLFRRVWGHLGFPTAQEFGPTH